MCFVIGLFTLRTWAIYQANLAVLACLCVLAFGSFVVNILAILGFISLVKRPLGWYPFRLAPQASSLLSSRDGCRTCKNRERDVYTLTKNKYIRVVGGSLSPKVFFNFSCIPDVSIF